MERTGSFKSLALTEGGDVYSWCGTTLPTRVLGAIKDVTIGSVANGLNGNLALNQHGTTSYDWPQQHSLTADDSQSISVASIDVRFDLANGLRGFVKDALVGERVTRPQMTQLLREIADEI